MSSITPTADKRQFDAGLILLLISAVNDCYQ